MLFTEYERLKREKDEEISKSKVEQLEKLQKDLGHGENIAMDAKSLDDKQYDTNRNPEICLGGDLEMEEEIEGEDNDEEERQELESFRRFLAREREKSSKANEK